MADVERQLRLLRFGDFEADLRSGELRKAGVKLKFGGQPFQVLTILLEQPGEVVTREELQKRLWPDTFVDVDRNLNTAINKIREVLGDSAESPRFVETLPRRGYRFIGEVEPPVEAAVPVEPDHRSISRSDFTHISWSPDGKWIAFADAAPQEEQARIYLLSTDTLEARQIPMSPMCIGEGMPAFSHNGEDLAYWCFLMNNGAAVLQALPISGGQPKTVSSSRAYPNGLTWSADDEKIIYSLYSVRGGNFTSELGEVTVANGSTKKLAFAGSAMLPTTSLGGDKLAYSSLSTSMNIWRRDLLHPESPAVELIPSSRAQFDAQYSPDGKRIAFSSLRSGVQGLWISSDDGSNLVQISNPHNQSGSPQWSPDGKKIAFDSRPQDRWEIYVADVAEGRPRKLATNISDLIRPHWSRDGKWIYFRSEEPGRMGIYRCPASGGDAIALSRETGVSPQESFDGKTAYFASTFSKPVLRKVSLLALPNTASDVDGLPRLSHAGLWTLSPGGIYFVPSEAPRSLRYFDFASKQPRPVFDLDEYFGSGLSISPDGRWVLYSQISDINSDIMLVDHFH
jgi:Tol biopolymer transport system component